MVDLDTLVQEKIEADADFQEEIALLKDEERETKLEEKRKEVLSLEFERLAKAEELAKNYKTRAEKAEAEAKKQKHAAGDQPETPTKEGNRDDLTSKDLFALMKANVHEDDVDEIVEYARYKKISVAEALKAPVIATTLEKNEEARKVADATNTRSNRSTRKTTTDAELLNRAAKGEIPEAGTDEAERLFWARRGVKKS